MIQLLKDLLFRNIENSFEFFHLSPASQWGAWSTLNTEYQLPVLKFSTIETLAWGNKICSLLTPTWTHYWFSETYFYFKSRITKGFFHVPIHISAESDSWQKLQKQTSRSLSLPSVNQSPLLIVILIIWGVSMNNEKPWVIKVKDIVTKSQF